MSLFSLDLVRTLSMSALYFRKNTREPPSEGESIISSHSDTLTEVLYAVDS